jgi:hypothetical protein
LALFGVVVPTAGKVWFIDRMAILYDDATPARPADVALFPTRAGTTQR